jgi:RNA polymerase sigma-19 factor, ECF subfamily
LKAPSTYHDQELLTRLRSGDKEAFAIIYQQYWDLLYGMAWNRLKDGLMAEDVVHDVFASLWRNRQKQQIQCLKSYLATAVKYIILKELRKAALLQGYRNKQTDQPLMPANDAALDARRILDMLQKEVATLPEKCRLVFRFSREEGMSVKQIADEMDISPKTVQNQLNKALKHLRVALKKHALFLFMIFGLLVWML